ncbi:hypothetical protein ADL27_38365 [Streptomyces sp. NRRL F-6602]|nr:hypothetical protein ADL27_38365 [Streptomyces sp. NRRL F-6602]
MADVEAILAPWIEARFPVTAGSETPPDLEKRLPFVRVERIGGSDERFTHRPRVAVDVFTTTADEGRHLSGAIRNALLLLYGPVGGGVVQSIRCDSGPSAQPWAGDTVRRRGATYTVTLRAT